MARVTKRKCLLALGLTGVGIVIVSYCTGNLALLVIGITMHVYSFLAGCKYRECGSKTMNRRYNG